MTLNTLDGFLGGVLTKNCSQTCAFSRVTAESERRPYHPGRSPEALILDRNCCPSSLRTAGFRSREHPWMVVSMQENNPDVLNVAPSFHLWTILIETPVLQLNSNLWDPRYLYTSVRLVEPLGHAPYTSKINTCEGLPSQPINKSYPTTVWRHNSGVLAQNSNLLKDGGTLGWTMSNSSRIITFPVLLLTLFGLTVHADIVERCWGKCDQENVSKQVRNWYFHLSFPADCGQLKSWVFLPLIIQVLVMCL